MSTNGTFQTEYVIWGLPPGKTDELDRAPLYTLARSMEEAQKVMAILEKEHGCREMTVQVLDGTLPDFAKTVK
jgi:hypothetical protein